jgi:glucokinase
MKKDNKYAIGVDLGGTYIKVGVVSEEGKIAVKTALETKAELGPKYVISQIKKGIEKVYSKKDFNIKGIGIGSPGVVSAKKGTIENPPNLPGWVKVNLGQMLEKEFGIDVFVENDANVAAIGELIFGAGKKHDSFVMVTLGTGVGGGIVYNKKLFRGEFGSAGEIGHMTIDHNGRQCNCGSKGCIEAYVGINYLTGIVADELNEHKDSLILKIIDNNMDILSPKIISQAASSGDSYAISVVERMGDQLGHAFASVSNLLDITTFILGGGVSGFGKPLFDAIEKGTKERILKSLAKRVKILPAKLHNEAGIKGASALVFYKS